MGGRMHRVFREEKPSAYAVTFFNQMAYETGAMGIYIGTSKEFARDVIRTAREEIEKIRREGISDKEVRDGKNYLIGTII
jgi:predicted Zn-dependent peptidase